MNRKTLAAAFPVTVPVLMGYLAIGMAFGLMLQSIGYGVGWAVLMSAVIYAGSGQYLGVSLLAAGAPLTQVAFLTLMVNFRHLVYGLSMLEKFRGMGVSACATCDGFFYRKKDVAVIGGGDTACEEATYLASLCRQVYLVVRKNYLRASKAMQERVFTTPNIEVIFEHNMREVLGDENGVTGMLLESTAGAERRVDVDGIFLAIGHHPNTELVAGQLELDEQGYIITHHGQTNVAGVFAAGDVQDPRYRQAITAAGSGCMAALECERFLAEHTL